MARHAGAVLVDTNIILEALPGRLMARARRGLRSANRRGVRVNDRWRAGFRWGDSGPEQVRVVDYH